jgi:hypothetical protein
MLKALAESHVANQEAGRGIGLNVGVFEAVLPTHTHIAREAEPVARVRALAEHGKIDPSSLWQKTGAVAINGWQALTAHELIIAKSQKEAATKALETAVENLQTVVEAEAVAAQGKADKDLSGTGITKAIKLVYVAKPEEQTCTRSSIKGKAAGITFLASLPSPWTSLLVPARALSTTAHGAATAAISAATAAEVAAFTDNQPPAPPSVVASGATTAAAIDVGAMSEAERRELMKKLTDAMP